MLACVLAPSFRVCQGLISLLTFTELISGPLSFIEIPVRVVLETKLLVCLLDLDLGRAWSKTEGMVCRR